VVGALASALAEMVAGVTLQKRGYEDLQEEMATLHTQAHRLRERLLDFAAKDSAAYQGVLRAYRLPKDDPQRSAQIQETMLFATEIPLQVCHSALEVLQLTERLAMYGSKTAVADVAVAVHLAHATLESASFNVRVNARELKNAPRPFVDEVQRLRHEAQQLYAHILTIAEKRAEIIETEA
jgi:formiminotetrahydrofolate cyclodeaminase